MNYGNAEQEIVSRLNTFFSSEEINKAAFYEAVLMPENEQQFQTFYSNFNKARIAVQYIDSMYDPSSSAGIIVQEEKAKFRLTFEARKLRGDGGIYNLIELVKLALIGFRLTNTDRLTVAKYGLLEFEQNAWQPYLEFECRTMNAQLHDDNSEPNIGGALTGIQSKSYNTTRNSLSEFQDT